MIDFAEARHMMVEAQVRTNDVTDERVQDAMRAAPRELFVAKTHQALAYMDGEPAITDRRRLMSARVFSKMAQAAKIKPGDLVLDVGCASGYSTVVLAALAETVVALEEDEALAEIASRNLAELGVDNGVVVTGPLAEGHAKQGPYDVIFVNGAVEVEPTALLQQLKPLGRLVAVVADGPAPKAVMWSRAGDAFGRRILFDGAAQLLSGFAKAPSFVF